MTEFTHQQLMFFWCSPKLIVGKYLCLTQIPSMIHTPSKVWAGSVKGPHFALQTQLSLSDGIPA